jgi:5-methylcytosine-specific restriction protein A
MPGCRNQSPCPRHSAGGFLLSQRGAPAKRGYDAVWKKARLVILMRDTVCQICKREPSTQVDHKIPLREGGARLDPLNLQGLCGSCHSRKTACEDSNFSRRTPV